MSSVRFGDDDIAPPGAAFSEPLREFLPDNSATDSVELLLLFLLCVSFLSCFYRRICAGAGLKKGTDERHKD